MRLKNKPHIICNIREARKNLGITQGVLARIIGIKQSQLCDYETTKEPELENMYKIVQAFNDLGYPCDIFDLWQLEAQESHQ